MKLAKLLTVTGVLTAAFTATVAFAGGWTSPTTPTGVYGGYTSGAVYIQGAQNFGACSKGTMIEFLPANGDPQKVLPLATAAFLSGKRIQCSVNGCNASGYQIGSSCQLVN